MTHDVTVSAVECGKCNGDIAQWTTREKESWVHMVHFEHLKAQKDALWEAVTTGFGEDAINEVIGHGRLCECGALSQTADALRAQQEAKK